MTRDELVETITRTLVGNDLDTEHFAFCRRMGVDVITVIEAAGLAIVPVEATEAMQDAAQEKWTLGVNHFPSCHLIIQK